MSDQDLSHTMSAMLRELDFMAGDKTLSAIASRMGTTNAGAAKTLRALEDRGLVRETINGTYALR